MGPNIFPSGSLEDHEFKNPLETYYEAILALSLTVFKILAKGLPYGDDVFDRFVSDDPVCILRLLHYPPQTSKDPRQLGAGAHTDFGKCDFFFGTSIPTYPASRSLSPKPGAVTLLYQTAPGLQVKSPSGSGSSGADRWIPVPPNRDAYVVNIGDMLHAWTEGLYKSSMHRVLNLGGSHRYSIPFFFDGNADCPLTPFGKSDDVGAETASEHLLRRLDETYAMAAKI